MLRAELNQDLTRDSHYGISTHPNTVFSFNTQPREEKKITPLGINQKLDSWGFIDCIEESGLYSRETGSATGSKQATLLTSLGTAK